MVELSDAQRQAIVSEGTPLPLLDSASGHPYLLFSVRLSSLPDGSIEATIPGLGIQGQGGEPGEAVYAAAIAAGALQRNL